MVSFQIAFYLILNLLYISLDISYAQSTSSPTSNPTSAPTGDESDGSSSDLDVKEIIFIICGFVIIILLLIIGGLLYIIMRYGNQKKRKATTGVTVDFNHNPTDTTSTFVNITSEQQQIISTTQTSPKSMTDYNTSIQSHNSHSPLNNHNNINNHHSMTQSQQLQLSKFNQNLPHQPQPKMNKHFGNINSLTFGNDIQHMVALQDRNNANHKGHRRQPSNAIVNVIVANDDAQDGDDNSSSDDQDGEQSSSSSFTVEDNDHNHVDELAHGYNSKGGGGTHGHVSKGRGGGGGGLTPTTPSTPLTPYQNGIGGASQTHSAQLTTPKMTPIMGGISGIGIGGGSGSNFSTPKIQGISPYAANTPTQGSTTTTQGSGVGYGGGGIQLPKPKTKGQWM